MTTDLSVFEVTLAASNDAASPLPDVAISVLSPLAAALAPYDKVVVECGGGGTCGPNSLGRVLAHAGLHSGDGEDIRQRVIQHATNLVRADALWAPAVYAGRRKLIEAVRVRDVLEASFKTWARSISQTNSSAHAHLDPASLHGADRRAARRIKRAHRAGRLVDLGAEPQIGYTAERWLAHMAAPTAWVDQAFLALAADCFAVEIMLHTVASTGIISHTQIIEPRKEVGVLARVELAYVVDQHILAILPSEHSKDMHSSMGAQAREAEVCPSEPNPRAAERRRASMASCALPF